MTPVLPPTSPISNPHISYLSSPQDTKSRIPLQRCISFLKNNFLEIKIKRNFGAVQIFKHHPYLSVRRPCDVSRSAPTADKPFYIAVPVCIYIYIYIYIYNLNL